MHRTALGTVDQHRDDVGSNRLKRAPDCLVAGRDQYSGTFGGEFGQRLGHHHFVVLGPIADCRRIAGGRPHDREPRQGNDHLAEAGFANGGKIDTHRRDQTIGPAPAEGRCHHPPAGFGMVGEHAGQARRFAGLLTQPGLPGPFDRGLVDRSIGDPPGQAGQWVDSRQRFRLAVGIGCLVHDARD